MSAHAPGCSVVMFRARFQVLLPRWLRRLHAPKLSEIVHQVIQRYRGPGAARFAAAIAIAYAIAACGITDRWSGGLGIVYPLVVIRT